MALRFALQPLMAIIAALHDGLKDARTGRSPYLWTMLTSRTERGGRFREGLIATGRTILIGLVMDTIYQAIVLKTLYPGEAVIIAILLAFVPYLLLRGPIARVTHVLIRDQKWSSRASTTQDLQVNADGTVDLFFGPKAPVGKESNWVPTGGRDFEIMMRFYGPEKPLFDKTWVLPDIEKNQLVQKGESSMSMQAKPSTAPLQVTEENFRQAESDLYFRTAVKLAGGTGKFHHYREPMPIDNQTVIRANRDTLYSASVFDLEGGPVTVTLPDPRGRFMSMQVFDEEQYSPETVYAPGTHTYTKENVGTRYFLIGLRTFIDPNDSKDIEQAHALQDAIKVEQPGGPGAFDFPNWDAASQKTVRDELIKRAASLPDTKGMFGPRGKVDPERHLIGTATGWGGNAPEDAFYLTVVPPRNDGKTVHKLTIKGEVPVDGFWSISVYGADGYFHKNEQNAYTLNGTTAKKDADGSITIRFGGCDGAATNCIPITPGWNYWARFYRPRKEILDGTWKFPEAKPVS